jgi:hypothetical protein
MNYKKIIRKTCNYKNKIFIGGETETKTDTKIGTDTKKVRWDLDQGLDNLSHHNPLIDFFNDSSNSNGLVVEGNAINSDVIKYLNKKGESYGSKLYSVNPVQAWISEDPDILVDRNNFTAHEIIGSEDSNTRIQDYRQDSNLTNGDTVGEVYDNMVDNFRVKWGQFEGLNGYDTTLYYSLDVNPNSNGYTEFATY